jgi:hypothetical protein
LFLTATATIHCSKKILLPDVNRKMRNKSKGTPHTMLNHEKDLLVLCFQGCGCTIYRKTVPIEFHTEAQLFGHLSLLPLSRGDGGRENI